MSTYTPPLLLTVMPTISTAAKIQRSSAKMYMMMRSGTPPTLQTVLAADLVLSEPHECIRAPMPRRQMMANSRPSTMRMYRARWSSYFSTGKVMIEG